MSQVADARHNYWLQQVTNKRNQGLVLRRAICQQIADNCRGAELQAGDTYRQLARHAVVRDHQGLFDGIVTAHYFDPGALVAQTTIPSQFELLSRLSETATPMVMFATKRPLRVYASVPRILRISFMMAAPQL